LSRSAVIVFVAALLGLAGCAQSAKKRGYDDEVGSRVHTVLLAQAPNQENFPTVPNMIWRWAPPGTLGLVALLPALVEIEVSTSRVTEAVDAKQTRLQDSLSEMLRDGLNAQGYEARIVTLPDVGEPDQFLPFLRQHGPADAALVVLLNASVGLPFTAESRIWSLPTTNSFPRLTATAKAFELGSGAVLYEDHFAYGTNPQGVAVYFPVDPKYAFADVAEMVANPARLREGWVAGMRMIADKILADLQRKPANAIPVPPALLAQASKSTLVEPGPKTGISGLRFLLRDTDPLTRVTTSDSIVIVESVSDRETTLNGGYTTLDPTGQLLTGTVPLPHIAGLGGGRLSPGLVTTAILIPTASYPPVVVRISALGKETLLLSGREIAVVRCSISGYAARGGYAGMSGALISGDIVVEPETGLVLSANVHSRHYYYAFVRNVSPAPR
jgi:hypothetical protein